MGLNRLGLILIGGRAKARPYVLLATSCTLCAVRCFSSTTLTDRYGEPLRTRLPGQEVLQQKIPIDTISPWMLLATLAAEDKRFYSHAGVDVRATARALWQNTREGRVVSGGSTVTQQLARLIEPHPKTLAGKFQESFAAFRLESRLTKRQILEVYLNEVYYGNHCRGVEAASKAYFGIPSRDLSLAEAALLAGIPKSPSGYDPVRRLTRAVERQRTVLRRMKEWGWLSAEAYALALSEPIRVLEPKTPWSAPHFTEYVRQKLSSDSAGIISTTIDAALQRELEPLVSQHLARLSAYHVTNAAVLVIDNASGDVLAWVGSADFADPQIQGQVDGVTSLRQPGSTLKPFLYGLAFSRGMTPASVLRDEPVNLDGYIPRNYDETYHGPVRAREALACSFNVPAVLVARQAGLDSFLSTLHAFGMSSLNRSPSFYGYGLALGNGEVTLLELSNAYAALARGGLWMPSQVFAKGPGRQRVPPKSVMDPESVFLVTDILSDNSARARAFGLNSPFHLPFDFAAKTGTTKDYRDNWSMGYTPDWTIGVWVGNFDGQPMRRISGITGAGPLLRDAAIVMEKRYGSRPFSRPRRIQDAEICPESGLLPAPDCPGTMREVFARGAVPTRVCPVHAAEASRGRGMEDDLVIQFPTGGDVFRLSPRMPRSAQAIRFRPRIEQPVRRVLWSVDQKKLPGRDREPWWTLEPGRHEVRLDIDLPGGRRVTRSATFMVVP